MFKDTKVFSSFSVNDIAAAKKFYGETLGVSVDEEKDMGLNLHLSGGQEVFIYPKPNHEPATFTVLNFMVDDINKTVDELNKAGIQMEHYDMGDIKTNEKGIAGGDGSEHPGPEAIAWFKDPAGNVLAVIQMK